MSQPPTPPGSPGQPLPQPQPQPWPLQGMQPTAEGGVDPDGSATDAASMPTDGDVPGWTPPPWSTAAAAAEKARLVGWAEWAASATFASSGRMSGYDMQEVDAFRSAVRDTFRGVRKPPVTSDDVRPGQWFSTHRRGYNKPQVDVFLEIASIRLAAMESTVKVTVVYESMFGNTRKVAQAIGDGVRGAYTHADVECVAVGKASEELIRSTDLLIVGGPSHLWRMTTHRSRKRHISRAKKAQAKGAPQRELEPDAEGPGLREWFYLMWPAKGWRHAAAFDTSLGSAPVGAGSGIARKLRGHGYELVRGPGLWDEPKLRRQGDELVTNPAGFILDGAFGPLRAGEIERAREWGARLVRTSVASPEGWAIWDRLVVGNE